MSDISITITADPQQALDGISKVKQAGVELAETAKKAQAATDAASTDAINSISTVSREMAQTISQTGDALNTVSGGIKTATGEAGKVAGAFGKSLPVIGQIGSALATAITGPVGAISAAVGLAVAGIMKMIQKAKDQVELLKMSAEGRTNAAYEQVMKGRQDYADQLQVLAQVREINRYAQQNQLTADQLAQFRQLAAQIGIAERDVGDRGIRSGKLGEAVKSMRHYRDFYAEQEYQTYLEAMSVQLNAAIEQSGLNREQKKRLAGLDVLEQAKKITLSAQSGSGWTSAEYKAYQDLYAMVKPLNEVTASYGRDKLLGRDQAALNALAMGKFQKSAASNDAGGSGGGTGKPLWEQQGDAAQAELDAQKEREKRGQKLLQGLDRQIQQQELIADGKEKEAFFLKNRLQLEDTYGKQLTESQIAEIDARSERLWALQHPQEPDLAPEDLSGTSAPARSRAQQQYAPRLDRLQQIGANLRSPAVSPEKLVMDKQLTTQEQIYALLQFNFSASRQVGGMMFP